MLANLTELFTSEETFCGSALLMPPGQGSSHKKTPAEAGVD
jgi:hypothetical protein